jgi:ATP-dependent protease HslVU (ClpYQ) peptidase subunit
MTAIAAVYHGRRTYMAADSLVTSPGGEQMVQISAPKIWRAGPLVIGCAGTLDYLATLAGVMWPTNMSPVEAWCLAREALARAKVSTAEGESLIGSARGLWMVDSATCFKLRGSVASIGAGSAYALGALNASAPADPLKRARAAVYAARAWCPSVGGRIISAVSDARRR